MALGMRARSASAASASPRVSSNFSIALNTTTSASLRDSARASSARASSRCCRVRHAVIAAAYAIASGVRSPLFSSCPIASRAAFVSPAPPKKRIAAPYVTVDAFTLRRLGIAAPSPTPRIASNMRRTVATSPPRPAADIALFASMVDMGPRRDICSSAERAIDDDDAAYADASSFKAARRAPGCETECDGVAAFSDRRFCFLFASRARVFPMRGGEKERRRRRVNNGRGKEKWGWARNPSCGDPSRNRGELRARGECDSYA